MRRKTHERLTRDVAARKGDKVGATIEVAIQVDIQGGFSARIDRSGAKCGSEIVEFTAEIASITCQTTRRLGASRAAR